MNFSVTQNGKELSKDKYTWDEDTRTFSTLENNLVLDFRGINNCTFKTGSCCTFDTGYDCTFKTGYGCTFKTGSYCTFDTDYNCTFKTGYGCTFDTDYDCTFDTGSYCTFKTGSCCTFDTDYDCTFKTGYGCTFDTDYNCTFKTGSYCVAIRRDIFEVIKLPKNKKVQLCPYKVKGYVKNGYYYKNGKKQYPAIIADGILSEVINHKGNVYKVKNNNSDKVTYLVQDGDIYSHGDTLKEAKDSLIYKISNRDTSEFEKYKLDDELDKITLIRAYRAITGACEAGTRYFCENTKLPEKCTIKKAIELTQGQYGNDKFREFFISKDK